MIANYGYADGSGEFFISIDAARCDGCRACVAACPQGILETVADPFDPLSDHLVAVVAEAARRRIRYTCTGCSSAEPSSERPCADSCPARAIRHSW